MMLIKVNVPSIFESVRTETWFEPSGLSQVGKNSD